MVIRFYNYPGGSDELSRDLADLSRQVKGLPPYEYDPPIDVSKYAETHDEWVRRQTHNSSEAIYQRSYSAIRSSRQIFLRSDVIQEKARDFSSPEGRQSLEENLDHYLAYGGGGEEIVNERGVMKFYRWRRCRRSMDFIEKTEELDPAERSRLESDLSDYINNMGTEISGKKDLERFYKWRRGEVLDASPRVEESLKTLGFTPSDPVDDRLRNALMNYCHYHNNEPLTNRSQIYGICGFLSLCESYGHYLSEKDLKPDKKVDKQS